jgi:hypothetical protein
MISVIKDLIIENLTKSKEEECTSTGVSLINDSNLIEDIKKYGLNAKAAIKSSSDAKAVKK